MKALTLHQPWASLIALGVKRIETRSWSTRFRGPLAIHAAKGSVMGLPRNDARPLVLTLGDYETFYDDPWGYYLRDKRRPGDVRLLPLGAVVATCRLVDVVPVIGARERITEAWSPHVAETCSRSELWLWEGPSVIENLSTGRPTWRRRVIEGQRPYGDFTPGRYAWVLDDVEPLEPVPARGKQGLWEWSL